MRARTLVLTFLALASGPATASTSVAWLAYPASARALAQAGGLGVLATGAESLGLNPAGVADLEGSLEAQLGYCGRPADISNQGGLVSYRDGDGGVGVKFNYVDFGLIQGYGTDAQGAAQASGSLHPNASDAAVGAGWRFGDVAVGGGAHWLNENLTGLDDSSSPCFEGGLKVGLTPRWVASASLVNAGSTLNGSALPTSTRVGMAVQSLDSDAWAVGVEANIPLADLSADVEAAGSWKATPALTLLAGLSVLGNNGGTYESLGASFHLRAFSLDYGFQTAGDLGVVNELSLRLNL